MKRLNVLSASLCLLPLTLTAQETVPPPRVFGVATLDAARSRLVLFGGMTSVRDEEPSGETWEYDGQRWQRMSTGVSPAGRIWHAMVYDPGRRRVVLFGGFARPDSSPLADTWEWDGATWTRGPDGPPGRGGHQLAWLPGRGRIVLWGGAFSFQTRATLDDEWEYDGRAWRQVRGSSPAAVAATGQAEQAETSGRILQAVMRSDLRNLVTAQESYFADNARYGTSLESVRFVPSRGVTIRLVKTDQNAWSALASHERAPRMRCGIFVGNVTPPFAEVRNEGEPVCVEGPPAR